MNSGYQSRTNINNTWLFISLFMIYLLRELVDAVYIGFEGMIFETLPSYTLNKLIYLQRYKKYVQETKNVANLKDSPNRTLAWCGSIAPDYVVLMTVYSDRVRALVVPSALSQRKYALTLGVIFLYNILF